MNNERREVQRIEHPFRRSSEPEVNVSDVKLSETKEYVPANTQDGGNEAFCGCLTIIGLVLFCLIGSLILIWNL